MLFVNGIPVATVELKTDFTQSIGNAVNQYRFDRSPAGEPLFGFAKRSLVHFVVSNSEVRMTTKLAGPATRFLPFNKEPMRARGTRRIRTGRHPRTFGRKSCSATHGCSCWGRSCTCRSKSMSTPTQGRRRRRRRCCSAVPPVASRHPTGRDGTGRGAGKPLPGAAFGGVGEKRTRSPGSLTASPSSTTSRTRGCSTRSWSSQTGRCWTSSCRRRSASSRSRPGCAVDHEGCG